VQKADRRAAAAGGLALGPSGRGFVSARLVHLNALRAFEVTARLGSYARAAHELAVTPAAVGQQVRTLEQYFGSALFERTGNRLVLTYAARAVLPEISDAFDRLAQVASRLRDVRRASQLTVSVAPSFAAKWLIPRIGSFSSAHPDVDVRLDATRDLADLARENIAVGIRYGNGRYAGLDSTLLLTEAVFPVCSPALAAKSGPLREPADLARVTLIHDTAAESRNTGPTWRSWLDAVGCNVDARGGLRVNSGAMALQAAIERHGVALARSVIAADDLREGRLVRPLSGACATGSAYYLVYPSGVPLSQPASAFCHWLKQAAREFGIDHGEPDGSAVRFMASG
jgi:LysR family glycine cleavage system transcriptional activator